MPTARIEVYSADKTRQLLDAEHPLAVTTVAPDGGVPATVTVIQPTHDSLNANVNLQINNLDNAAGNPGFMQLTAGEAHVGEVGASSLTIDVVPTIDTAAYTAGDCVGGLITLANAARVDGGSGIVQSLTLGDADAQDEPYQIIFFSANPSASTTTDQNPVNIVEADLAKIVGIATLYAGDYVDFSATSAGKLVNLGIGYDLPSGTSLFAVLMAIDTPDYTQTDALKLGVHVLRN